MSTFLITVLIAVVALAFFVLGLSITRIRKGHDLESDVGSNRDMKRLGIACASAQIRGAEAEGLGSRAYFPAGCDGSGGRWVTMAHWRVC